MWNAGGTAADTAALAGHAAETVGTGRNAAGALAVSSPGELLAQFQEAHPVWARWIAGLLMLFTGMSVGRLTVRYNLYSVGTCLAIPLYGAIACGLAVGGDYLTAFAASALMALATKNFCRSYCYVNWGTGGGFLAPVAELGSAFVAGMPLSLFLSTPVQSLVLLGAVFILDLMALLFFLSDIHALGTKPRLIFIFNISVLLLTAAVLCGPAATPGTVALAAVPSAVLLPFMFVRIHRAIALPLYLLLLAPAVISTVLQ